MGIMGKNMETTIIIGDIYHISPFLGTLNMVPYYNNRDPKRDHNFDKHPCGFLSSVVLPKWLEQGLQGLQQSFQKMCVPCCLCGNTHT